MNGILKSVRDVDFARVAARQLIPKLNTIPDVDIAHCCESEAVHEIAEVLSRYARESNGTEQIACWLEEMATRLLSRNPPDVAEAEECKQFANAIRKRLG